MSNLWIGIIGLIIIGVMMCFSIPVALVFAVIGFTGVAIIVGFHPALSTIATIPAGVTLNYTWTTMPMFVLMGYFAFKSGIIDECYQGFRVWVGRIRGGLAHTVILGNAAFGAVSGSGIAAALTFCAVSLPEMRRSGYRDTLSLGAIGAGTLLAGLIPPSLPFIVFGGLTNVSIGKLFISGIIPGVLLTLAYLVVIAIWCKIDPKIAPPLTTKRPTIKELVTVPPGVWIIILVFVVLIGGLYMGAFTPTEGGAVAAFLILVVGLARRKLKWEGIKYAAIQTGLMAGMFFLILIGVMIFNLFIVMTGLNQALIDFMTSFSSSPHLFLIMLIIIYIILGTFMDTAAIILITVPMIFPVSQAIGVDPFALGVIVTITGTLGALSPPYGTTVFAMAGAVKDVQVNTLFKGFYPFYIPMIALCFLVVFVPQVASWLPSLMK
jgi:C4-dicarboxylate transporter, DctM subunit